MGIVMNFCCNKIVIMAIAMVVVCYNLKVSIFLSPLNLFSFIYCLHEKHFSFCHPLDITLHDNLLCCSFFMSFIVVAKHWAIVVIVMVIAIIIIMELPCYT